MTIIYGMLLLAMTSEEMLLALFHYLLDLAPLLLPVNETAVKNKLWTVLVNKFVQNEKVKTMLLALPDGDVAVPAGEARAHRHRVNRSGGFPESLSWVLVLL